MLGLMEVIDRIGPLLWQATWQATVLAGVVLVVQAILRGRLPPAWRFALWLVVLARLLLPVVPASPVSLFGLPSQVSTWRTPLPDPAAPAPMPTGETAPTTPPPTLAPAPDAFSNAASAHHANPTIPGPAVSTSDRLTTAASKWTTARLAGLGWFVGVLVLLGRMLLAVAVLRRWLRGCTDVDDPRVLRALDNCRTRMGIRSKVRLRVAQNDVGPAVIGIWCPCVVLPESVLQSLPSEQLEHVLLHELAHVKRWDVLVHWLIMGARVLHWFNPAVWLVTARMLIERELACDAAVLVRVAPVHRAAYGQTLLRLAERLVSPQLLPGLVGVFASKPPLFRRITAIARFRPAARAWSLVGLGLLGVLALLGLTRATPTPAEPAQRVREQIAILCAGPVYPNETEADRKAEETLRRIQAQLMSLRTESASVGLADAVSALEKQAQQTREQMRLQHTRRAKEQTKDWARAVRTLAEIGPPAVPLLVEELDRSDHPTPLRSLGFALRAIGDPRAVPAMIRAIPRILQSGTGDYGLLLRDKELIEFLQEHDLDPRPNRNWIFDYGTQVREVFGALEKLTGQEFDEKELYFVHLEGGPEQQAIQRRLFRRCAERWATWWEANWKQFTDDAAFAKVNLPPQPEEPTQPAISSGRFRRGGGISHVTLTPYRSHRPQNFLDLDTGRFANRPDVLPPSEKPGENPKAQVLAWAAREGFDLMATEYRAPDSDRTYCVLRAVGLQAWHIKQEQRDKSSMLRKPEGQPVGDLLMARDQKTLQYQPESETCILFITREGTSGILRVDGQRAIPVFEPTTPGPGAKPNAPLLGVGFAYETFYEDREPRTGTGRKQEAEPVSFLYRAPRPHLAPPRDSRSPPDVSSRPPAPSFQPEPPSSQIRLLPQSGRYGDSDAAQLPPLGRVSGN